MTAERPVRVDGKRLVSMPAALWSTILTTLLGVAITATLAWGAMKSDIRETNTALALHETRLKSVEIRTEDLLAIKTDIAWIKRALEEDRHRNPGR